MHAASLWAAVAEYQEEHQSFAAIQLGLARASQGAGATAAGLRHATFKSPSMGISVGYHIYLPPGYESQKSKRYPVVYHLHGGRPGGENKSIALATFVDKAIRAGKLRPTLYVFPNGGPMSWYNFQERKMVLAKMSL